MPKNKVLVPLNKSELSHRILLHVEKFISAAENDLILFFITKPPRGLGFAAPDPGSGYELEPGGEPVGPKAHPIYADQQEASIKANVETDLLPLTNRLKELGYSVSVVVEFGENAAEALTREISKQKIDLVAMSTKANVGVTSFFFRDLADIVAQQSNIPILLVHPENSDS